ncbi:hypothetical protein CEP54_006655 [Fusarium duplospermum]|uniref:Uncharacterized protein n=1 Tax=Fusarium duplospermum TaxID=1325734 RepID=A0A428Q5Q0_9HYPO|nr:hypothetical protein CEP54_006655 [Fusarium duplospermum]
MSGLEILGAVASSIALAQAVQGTIKAVNLLREIRQIRQQCDELKNEARSIHFYLFSLPLRPQPPPGMTQEHPTVSRAIQELQGIQEALDQIVSKYSNDRKWHDPRRIARKMQWLSESKKIEELARKAQNTKLNLHFAITLRTSSSIDRIGTQQEVILHSIKQHTIYYLEGSQQSQTGLLSGPLPSPIQAPVPGPVEGRVEEIETEGDSCSETSEASAQSMTDSLQVGEFQSLSLADENGGYTVSIQEESYTSLTTMQPLGTRRCGQDCQCRCHEKVGEDDNYSWMSTVLGSWRVRNQTVDRTCEMQCGPSLGPEFEYRPPRWLWSRAIPFGSFRHGQPVLTCSLRAPRTICWKENVWRLIKRPSDFQKCIRDGWTPFPDDTDEFGRDFMQLAIMSEAYESIGILLELWKNVLPQQGLSREVGYYVNFTLVDRSWSVIDDRARHVLIKALSLVHGCPRTRRIHQAAKQGDTTQMRQALREQPEAIEELDSCGKAPIHYAVMDDNVDVLEQLILAGADTIRRDFRRHTPLVLAVAFGHEEATQILLENDQCRHHIGIQDDTGRTALHCAVEEVSLECVHMLLEAGASVEKRDFLGWTPLHYLARSQADQQTAHRIIRLFQGQHARLDAQDNTGVTPTLRAVINNNVPVLRTLVDAGASLNTKTTPSQNILHFAARYAGIEMMSYLAEQHLTLVDPRLRDFGGLTPLGRLGWCWETEDLQLYKIRRRPSLEKQQGFISLYFDLLSHYLLRHMSTLKQLLRAAEQRDASTSSERITALIQKSDVTGREDMVKWYRGIQGNLRDGNWEQVVLDVQDEYDEAFEDWCQVGVARNKTLADPEVRAFF